MDERLLMFVNLVVVDAVSAVIERQYQTASGEGVGVAEQSLIKQNISEHDFPQDLTRRGPLAQRVQRSPRRRASFPTAAGRCLA